MNYAFNVERLLLKIDLVFKIEITSFIPKTADFKFTIFFIIAVKYLLCASVYILMSEVLLLLLVVVWN